MRRVVVTGMGAVTPIGIGVENFWNSVKEKRTGFDKITKFDTTGFKASLAAEIKDFDPKEFMDFKAARRMELFCQYAVAAAAEAMKNAGIDMGKEDPYRVGCYVGSGIGSLQAMEREHKRLLERGASRINPLLVPLMISNMACGNVSIQLGLKGKSLNVVTACATGTHSIGEAFRSIQIGDADVIVAGGTEAAICPMGVGGFSALTALSSATDPKRCSIPFDKNRSGFVMGEGAGVVILEELSHAQARNANILAEVVGYGCTSDAYHITSPAEDGSGAAKAMELAIKEAGAKPEDVDYINAHGTSTHHNDLFETRAIKLALKEAAKNVKVNSTKSMIGHLLGAAGGVEFITCVKSINEGYIHQTVGLTEPDESYHGIIYTQKFGKLAYITKATSQLMRDLGSIQSPQNAFLINVGLETLHLRMPKHCENALKVATYLKSREDVAWVNYPGLEGDKYYELAKKYMPNGTCGVISFGLKSGRKGAADFMDKLKLCSIETHVADSRTAVLHPASHTHRQLTNEQLVEAGVDPSMIRFSVGIEDAEDIIEDIRQALED